MKCFSPQLCIYIFFTDTDKTTLDKIETELTELGFDCWETSVGGHGVISHSANLDSFNVPKMFI